ncbi:MAG: PQQ-binding-like beta-propeller repeat protein [Gracilimonas sp.]|uniref:outer membrane protein assembly factor BamB family protein n=1 Tax=Gracilimonas sp. TaxID=1974203 RepID=UPI00375253AD|nr:PQQ-binding-like beta-propeller repeat protein [Gracilimonas sp.]
MKYLILIITIAFIQSCFESPTDPKTEKQNLSEVWSYEHGTVGDAPPIISMNTIYASGGLYLFALNQDTGEKIWQAQIDNDSELKGKLLLMKENQIVANHLDRIRGWNRITGNLEWEYVYSDDLEPRLIGDHVVTKDGYAFNASNGKFFVLNELGKLILEKQLDRNYAVQGLAYYEDHLFIGQKYTVTGALTLGRITVLNAQTGDSLWAFDTDQGGFSWVAPIVEDGVLYASTIGNSSGEIAIALDAETGEELWRQTNEIFTFNSALGPTHYYINTSGSLAALNKQTGAIEWRVDWEGSDFNKPVYLAGYVYHVRDKEMLIINDADGEVVHHEPVPDGTYFWHVAASNDKIFAQTSRQLIAYQPWHLMVE